MTFDAQVQSLTQFYIVPAVVDDVVKSNVAALLFLSNGKQWMGETLRFPIKLSQNTQNGSFDDYSEFSTSNQNVRQVAVFDPRAYYQSVVIGGIAQSVNAVSKTQVLNLVKVEMESAHQDMVDGIGTIFYADGTGNSNRDFLGLAAGIDDGTNIDAYGGLSRATYANWKSIIQTSTGAFSFSKARTLFNSSSVGNQKPTIAVCNDATFAFVENQYTTILQGRYDVGEGPRYKFGANGAMPTGRSGLVGAVGFDQVYFAGTPIVRDSKVGSQKLIAINDPFYSWYGCPPVETNPISLEALYHEGNDYGGRGTPAGVPNLTGFGWTGFVRPAKQYAFIGQVILIGNLVTPAPRLHSSSSGISS